MLYANTKDCSSDKRVNNLAYFLVLITTRKSSGKPTTGSSGKLPEDLVKSSPSKTQRSKKSDKKAPRKTNPPKTKAADKRKECEWYDIVCKAQKLLFGSPTISPVLAPKTCYRKRESKL